MAERSILGELKQKRMLVKQTLLEITESLWFRPILWVGAFSVMAFGFIALDWYWLHETYWNGDGHLFWKAHPEGARTMLGAIAGATLTVVSLAFSLMMVVVIQTANAYTPRLIKQFIADKQNHHVLGVLMGCFAYAIVVLRSVEDTAFLPHLAVNVAVLLSIVSIITLISFIHHVASSIQVGNIVSLIESQTSKIISSASYRDVGSPYDGEDDADALGGALTMKAIISGYLQLIDTKALAQLLEETPTLVLEVHHAIGDHILQGTPLVTLYGEGITEDVCQQIRDAYVLGEERAWEQDMRYGFEQLTDIALRALSPGINDPTTGVMAINAISRLIAEFMMHPEVLSKRCNSEGQLFLVFEPDGLPRLLRETFLPILHYGCDDHRVVSKLISTIGELGYVARQSDDLECLRVVLETITQKVDRSAWTSIQREQLDDMIVQSTQRVTASLS